MDGTLAKCPKNKLETFHKVANDISKEFKVDWEFALLKGIYFSNTNTYLSDDDLNEINVKFQQKIKKKGAIFRYGKDIPLGDSVNEQVIAKSLENYLINNIPVKEYITNPDKYNLTIFDYLRSNKINKQYEVFYNGVKQQNLNRYYFSKKGSYLFKRKKGKTTMEHVNVGHGVILFNNYEKKNWEDYDIDFSYYVNKANKIISDLRSNYQLALF